MKLQYLIVVFIIIAIPLIVFLTYYMSLQKATLDLQTSYDTKIITAARQAMEAFEVNTVEWDKGYSRYADEKRRDILASINTFITSFSNGLSITGTNKEAILTYIPAIMYNLYDGFYIYTPTSVPKTKNNYDGIQLFEDSNDPNLATTEAMTIDGKMNKILYVAKSGGRTYKYTDENNNEQQISGLTTDINNARKEYKHVLKTYITYSEKLKKYTEDIIINYTLDNYVRVYTANEERSGYLIDTSKFEGINTSNIKYNGVEIIPEELSENVAYLDKNNNIQRGNYRYVYNMYNEKCYNDNNEWFKIKNEQRVNLGLANIGDNNCEYKKLSIVNRNNRGELEIVNLYQPINLHQTGWSFFYEEYMLENPNDYGSSHLLNIIRKYGINFGSANILNGDFSAINYYTESYVFTNWAESKLNGINVDTGENPGDKLETLNVRYAEDEDSVFNRHKKFVMKNAIKNNLNLAISSYSAHNNNMNFELPIFTYEDWEKILSNVSMTAFMQEIPIGLKNYNNYVIAVSSNNKEFINPEEIYYISDAPDYYYHRKDCSKTDANSNFTGYRNIDFLPQRIEKTEKINTNGVEEEKTTTIHYFKHAINGIANEKCYYCLIAKKDKSTDTSFLSNPYETPYFHAIARERYIQKK